MAGSVNKAIILGRLGKDPEIRSLNDGSKVASLTVATSESWKDKATGEKMERTEWHRVAIFNPHLADIAERYLKKGSMLHLEGKIQTRKWQDNTGADRYTTEIVLQKFGGELTLLGDAAGGAGNGGGQAGDRGTSTGGGMNATGRSTPATDLDDEIPF